MSGATYSFVICRSSGENVGEAIGAKQRQWSQVVNAPSTATVSVQLGDRLAALMVPSAHPRCKVYRTEPGEPRELVFYGSLPQNGFSADAASDTLTCKFQDPAWIFARRYSLGTETFTATDQGLILWGLVAAQNARSGGDTWIRQGNVTTGVTRDRAFSRQTLAQLFDDMTKVINGCDWEIAPVDYYELNGTRAMGVLNVYDEQGSDRPNAVFGYSPSGVANIQNATLAYLDVTTIATVTGVTTSQGQISGTAGTAEESGFGLLEQVTADQDVSVQATVDAKAQGIVAEQNSLRPVVGITGPLPDAPQPVADYGKGDTVRVAILRGAFQQVSSPRMMAFTVDVGQEGELATTLVLATPPGAYVEPPTPPDEPDGGGGGPPSAPLVITAPTTTHDGTGSSTTTPGEYYSTSPGHTLRQNTGGVTAYISQRTILGLTIGNTYTVKAWVRGKAEMAQPGTDFRLLVGGNGGLAGATFSANDAAHVFSANAATRTTWQQLSVTFTATATTEYVGAKSGGATSPFNTCYLSDWTIE